METRATRGWSEKKLPFVLFGALATTYNELEGMWGIHYSGK